MKIGIASPIPVVASLPGPSRPGWPSGGAFEFKMEIQGPATLGFNASKTGGGTNFSIDWGDTTTASGLTGTSHSHTYAAGTFTLAINSKDDTGPIDTFQLTGTQTNKNRVTQILSWGKIPWKNLNSAFQNCQGLTKINGGVLLGGVNCNLNNAFKNCTGLTEAICENWDLSSGCSTYSLFESCTNLELLDLTGAKFAVTAASNFSFYTVGTNVSSGCDFKMSGLNLTGTTNNTAGMQWFKSSKFKDGSNLSNWTFPSTLNSVRGTEMFNSSIINGTLDLSNWIWPNQEFPSFTSINSALTSQNGSKIKLSNWDVSVVSNFANKFNSCKVYELEGLSTWGACAGNASMFRMFSGAVLMRINPSDNFSNAFMASLTPIYVNEMFRNFSRDLLDAERGPCPNLSGLNLSNLTAPTVNGLISFMNNSHFTNTPDFSNVTFSSNNTVNFSNAFRQFDTIGTGSDSIFNFNPTTVKPANFTSAFYFAHGLSEVNIGSNVDMSSAVDFNDMFRLINNSTAASTFTNVTFPTNADFSSLTSLSRTFEDFSGNPIMSVCQTDNFIRRLKATNNNTNLTVNFYANKVTEAPSVVRSDVDYLENTKGWNITLATPDATLPFAYPAYFVDRDVYSNITPSNFPAGSTFSSTNAGMTINQNTGVISWASNFSGESVIRCTYPDGCYNEVNMLVGVPMVYKVTVGDSNYGNGDLGFQVQSIGDYRTQSVAIDLGDGTTAVGVNGINHTYAAAGDYNISIFGNFDPWFYNLSNDANKLREVSKWGESNHSLGGQYNSSGFSQRGAFNGCNNMDITATDACIFLPGRSLLYAFVYCYNLTNSNGSMNTWDVSEVTDFGTMFFGVYNKQFPVDQWVFGSLADTGGISLSGMFQNTSFNTDISTRVRSDGQIAWDTEGVTSMSSIFRTCTSFKQDISNWNTDNVVSLYGFQYPYGQNAFGMDVDMSTKQVTVGTKTYIAWDVKSCTNFANMFGSNQRHGGAKPRNLINWNTSSATTMSQMFYKARVDPNGPAWNLTPRQVTVGTGATARTYNAWDVSNVENFSGIFNEGVNRSGPNSQVGITRAWIDGIEDWDVSGSTGDFKNAFYKSNIGVIDLSSWNASIEKGYFFSGGSSSFISSFAGLDITNLGTGSQSNWGYWSQNTYTSINASGTTTNYDETLIAWGAQSANIVNTTSLDFGTSKYSPGNALAVSRGNVGNPAGIPSGQMFVYDANVVLKNLTSVGDIVQLMNGGSAYGEFAKITGYLATDDRVAFVDVLGGANFPVNWPGVTWQYQIYDSDAAKGRYALLEAGWTITDGGVDIQFESAEIEIEIAPGQETFALGTWPMSTKIDWGDGNGFINNPATSQPYTSHTNYFTYPTVATGTTDIYRIKIRENDTDSFNGFRFGQYGHKARVRKIVAWGSQISTTYAKAFQGADLNKAGFTNTLPVDANGKVTKPTWVSSITNFQSAFSQCNMPANADWSNWATGLAATNLSSMFSSNTNFTCTGLSNWDLSKVTNISSFVAGTAFNSDISGWDLQSCIYASGLFSSTPFNHPSISNLNLHNISNISSMFLYCTAFNQDVNTKVVGTGADAYLAWDTDPVTVMFGCFKGCSSFNYSIDKWNIGQLDAFSALASFFYGVGSNLTNGYTHDLLTKDVTVGAGTPAAKTYVAWDVGQVNGFGGTSQSFTSTQGMFQNSKFNGDISNWDMSGLGAQGSHAYSPAGEWGRVFYNNPIFNQDISTKTITNVSGKGTYTAWDMSNWKSGGYVLGDATAFDQNIGNWTLSTTDVSNGNMLRWWRYSGMSSANYTDTFVGWANTVYSNGGFPKNKSFSQGYSMTFDSNRSGGANFANAWEARSYLTDTVANGGAGWSISGDTVLPLLVPSTSSLEFNGSTEYIDTQVSPRTLVGNSNAYTISAYVFIEEADIAEENYFIIGAMSGTERWYFRVNDGYVGFGYGTIISSTTLTPITAGQWNHVAVTYNGTNTHKIYVDGGSPKYTSTSSTGQTITTNNAYIGALNNGGAPSLHFKGKIDEVMVWNTELAQANIQTLANAVGSGNVTNPEQLSSGLQLWNRMGD